MDYIDIILLLVSAANIFYGIFIFNRNRESISAYNFFLLTIVITVWGASMFLLRSASDPLLALLYTKLLYTAAAFIPLFSVFFALQFPDTKNKISTQTFLTLIAPLPFVLWLVWQPNMLILDVLPRDISDTNEPHVLFNVIQHLLYTLYVSFYFLLAHIFLFSTLKKGTAKVSRQVRYIMIGTVSTVIISTLTNIVLPFMGNFAFNWVGPTATTAMFFTVSYSVYRHRTFNLKVAFSEILALFLVSILLIDLLTSTSYVDSIVLLVWKFIMAVVVAWVAKSFLDGLFAVQESKKKLATLNKKLKEFDEKKTEFLHVATHQLRGPVTAINGYAALMKDGDYGKVSKEMKDPIVKILSAGKVMKDTINDYMNIARIEENRLNQVAADFDLSALVRERANVLQLSAKEKGIELDLDASLNKKHIVHADKQNLTQVMNALLENAIKYTKKGSVRVKMELTKDGKHIQVAVSDSGIGVAKKELDGLFDKFSRASNAKKANIFGTGMGLFIAKGLMKANGGSIKATSEGENKGTTFTIELPVVL